MRNVPTQESARSGPPEPPPFDPPPPSRRPEPPPFDGPPTPPRQRPPQRATPKPSGPWAELKTDLERLGGSATRLASGRPHLDRGTLTISLRGGLPLADGRRALRNAEVVDAVARHYGDGVQIDVTALPDTGTVNDRRQALAKKVLEDPDVQRVVAVLGATLLRVIPLTDGD